MTALSFVWVHPYSQNSRCDNIKGLKYGSNSNIWNDLHRKGSIIATKM